MKKKKVPITCKVLHIQADTSEYMQRSVELEPVDLHVVIELPLKKKYFCDPRMYKYWEEVTVSEVMGEKVSLETPSPIILSPEGLAKTRQLVNAAFKPTHTYAKGEGWDDDDVIE